MDPSSWLGLTLPPADSPKDAWTANTADGKSLRLKKKIVEYVADSVKSGRKPICKARDEGKVQEEDELDGERILVFIMFES